MKPAAIITGGTRGIGLGIAQALAAEGFDLALCGRRSSDEVKDVISGLQVAGSEVLYKICDMASKSQRQSFLIAVRKRFGCPRMLVNNAGMVPARRNDILEATESDFEAVLKANLQGPYFLTRDVARLMIEQRSESADFNGCIVNIGSVSAVMASINRGEYCISKAGIAMATRLWALRLAEHGIFVYEVRPGITKTDMTAAVAAKYDKLIEEGLVPQRRWGHPKDTGRLVAALARGELAYSTGQVVYVDGGLHLERL